MNLLIDYFILGEYYNCRFRRKGASAMDLTSIGTLISSVGFPIVMSLLFFYYVRDTQAEMTEAINNLKTSIDKLYSMITHMKDEGEM